MFVLIVELRVFVRFRVLATWIAQLCQNLLSRSANKIGLHVVNATFWINEKMIVFTFNLNLLTDYPIYHINRFFTITVTIFLSLIIKV